MKKNLHTKILEFLNDQDVSKEISITTLLVDIFKDKNLQNSHDAMEVSGILYETLTDLKNRGYIKNNNKNFDSSPKPTPFEFFEQSNVLTKITLDGIKYLQSEQDAKTTRDFLKIQKFVLGISILVSVVSCGIAYFSYDLSKNQNADNIQILKRIEALESLQPKQSILRPKE